jgi:hypothetical protein
VLVLTFGALAFEFVNRSRVAGTPHAHGHWTSLRLGEMFRQRAKAFAIQQINVLPLLHVTIARGKFLQSHENFCGAPERNYFDHCGEILADLLLRHRDALDIWIAREE